MALTVTHDCIACAACVPECPNAAIAEGEGVYVIDSERCRECVGDYDEPHCVPSCPVDAIVPDPNHPLVREGQAAASRANAT
jgi:ferredoxin